MKSRDTVRVLVVDDNSESRAALRLMLGHQPGWQVVEAVSGTEAVAEMRTASGGYDVVVMDQRLGKGPSGTETMALIRHEYPSVPVIVITGFGNIEVGLEALRNGARTYMQKPIDRDELIVHVTAAADERRLRAALDASVEQTAILKSMLAISSAIQGSLDLQGVLATIADRVRELVRFRYAAVSTIDADGMVRVRGVAGLDENREAGLYAISTPKEIFWHPMQERFRIGRSYLIRHDQYNWEKEYEGDIVVPDLGDRAPGEWHPYDVMRTPILSRANEAIGILSVDDPIDKKLPSNDTILTLELFASQAAIAIENATLHEKARQRGEQLSALDQIALDIAGRRDPDTLLSAIVLNACTLLSGSGGALYLLDDKSDAFVIKAVHGLVSDNLGRTVGKKEGVLGVVYSTKQPFAQPRYLEWEHRRRDLDACGISTVVGAPIMSAGGVIGVLIVHDTETGRIFEEAELELLSRLAGHAAVALENLRAWRAEREAVANREQLEALWAASKEITSAFAGDTAHVLNVIVEQAVRHIPAASSGLVHVRNPETGRFCFASAYPTELLAMAQARFGDGDIEYMQKVAGRTGVTGRAIAQGSSQCVSDVHADRDYVAVRDETASELAVPMKDGGTVIGALNVESDQVNAFDDSARRTLEGLAEMATVAIKSARQAEDLERAGAVAVLAAWGTEVAHEVNRTIGDMRLTLYRLAFQSGVAEPIRKELVDLDVIAGRLAMPVLPFGLPSPDEVIETQHAGDLDEVVRETVASLQPELAGRSPEIDVRAYLSCSGERVRMHPFWIRTLIRHLIANALQALTESQRAGTISVRTRRKGERFEVAIADTGDGVPPAIVPVLFRKPLPGKDGRRGTGLLVVQCITGVHGGSAYLVKNTPGGGCEFAFDIPAAVVPAGGGSGA